MLEFRASVGWFSGLVMGFALLAPSVVLAAGKEQASKLLQTEAMQTDYAETNFKKAEQKLKKAISQCGASGCSKKVVGELHRDLATVYIAGMKQSSKGKSELKLALKANPDLELDEDFATPELRKLFKELGGHEPQAAEEEKPAKPKKEEECEEGTDGCEVELAEKVEEGPPSKYKKTWLSLHFQQDFLLYSSQDNVCGSAGAEDAKNYSCFQNGAPFNGTIAPGPGNHVSGGLGLATSRVLIGFDRLLSSNFMLGLRLGYAFGGRPPGADKFFPFHAELKASYWFGSAPFESSSVRPYVTLSGGLTEVDGKVSVEYYDDTSTKRTLDAWRKTGKGFAALGFGVMVPFAGDNGIVPELRAMQLFGASGTAFDVSLGYARGF